MSFLPSILNPSLSLISNKEKTNVSKGSLQLNLLYTWKHNSFIFSEWKHKNLRSGREFRGHLCNFILQWQWFAFIWSVAKYRQEESFWLPKVIFPIPSCWAHYEQILNVSQKEHLGGLLVEMFKSSGIFKIKRWRGTVVLKSALLPPEVKCVAEWNFITITKNLLFRFLFQPVKPCQILHNKTV